MKNLKTGLFVLAVLLGIALVLLSRSCGSSSSDAGESGLLIFPEEVAVVVGIDLPQIFREVSLDRMRSSTSYQEYLQKARIENPVFAEVLNDPVASGVRLDEKLYFGLWLDHEDAADQFSVIALALNDATAFEKTVARVTKKNIREYPTFNSVHLDKLTPIGWNQNFVLFGATSLFVDLDEKLSRFFNTPSSKSLATNPDVINTMNSGEEFSIWACSDFMANNKEWQNVFGLGGLDSSLVKGNYIYGHFNFDKGLLEGLADLKLKPEVKTLLTRYFSGNITDQQLKYLPKENLGFFMGTALNLPGFYNNLVKAPGTKAFIEQLLQKHQIAVADFFKAFGGEVLLASYKEKHEQLPVAILIMDIANPEKARKVTSVLAKLGFIQAETKDQYLIPGTVGDTGGIRVTFPDQKMRLYQNEELLCISSDIKLLQNIRQGGLSNGQQLVLKEANKGMLTTTIDANVFPDIVARAGQEEVEHIDFSIDDRQLRFQLAFKDKERNLLQQLFDFR